MSVHTDRIAELQERLKRQGPVVRPDDVVSGSAGTAGRAGEGLVWPSVASDTPRQSFCLLLELLATRDEYIHQELFRLQRTLSRQNFRGAESARRLVRRLARRAEQNTADALAARKDLLTDGGPAA
jgi:hypothetical protein